MQPNDISEDPYLWLSTDGGLSLFLVNTKEVGEGGLADLSRRGDKRSLVDLEWYFN